MIVARTPAAAGSRKSGSASIIYELNESQRTEGCCVSVGRVTGGVPPERMADLSVRVAWAVARITSKEGVYATNPETGFYPAVKGLPECGSLPRVLGRRPAPDSAGAADMRNSSALRQKGAGWGAKHGAGPRVRA